MLTEGAQLLEGAGRVRVEAAGMWGLGRAARAEAELPLRCVDVAAAQRIATGDDDDWEMELAHRPEATYIARLTRASDVTPSAGAAQRPLSRSHVVSGGTGGLGLLTARWLAGCGAARLALASRSGAVAIGAQAEWMATSDVLITRCDAAEPAHVRLLMASVLTTLEGVWHAAGTLADALLQKQTTSTLTRVFAPKSHGAWSLQQARATADLHACVLFSSVSALFGGAGQANYSAANACLDAVAACGRVQGLVSASVQWGAWAEVGMAARGAANERMEAMEASSGFGRVWLAQGLEALSVLSQPGPPVSLPPVL